jgi:dipeptidyl aminopeptidase/acylaminoacyl peptidase
MTILRPAALAAALSFACAAHAAPPSIEDFAKHAEITEAAISPTGEYVAFGALSADGLETHLKVMRLDGSEAKDISIGKHQHIANIYWASDRRIVIARGEKDFNEERPHATGELYAVDADGKHLEMLFGYVPDIEGKRGRRQDQGYAAVNRVLDEDGQILVSYFSYTQGPDPQSVVYRVNALTGDRKEIERVDHAESMSFDQSGRLRVTVTLDDQDLPHVFYRPTPESELVPMPSSLAGYEVYGGWFGKDNNIAYLNISDKGEASQLYRVDFAKGTREKVAGKADQDIGTAQISGRHGAPFAITYDAGRPAVDYVDKESMWAQLHMALMQKFGGQMVSFLNFTRDEGKLLFYVYSDRNPGAYYLYDKGSKKISLVAESLPWLKAEQLAPMQPVEFAAKDGTKLFGFYTANGSGPKPLVVMPHGGPIGPYDSWGYDEDAQFLASRGYAVLQVNYRGSGGRGHNFEVSGWKQYGYLIQDDIADGVRWAIAQGKADPSRVCIYGASFGGYSAMLNPVRNPGMYKCAIGYAGLYDLGLWESTGFASRSRQGQRIFDRMIGTDDAKLDDQSPAKFAAKIDIPVFLAHGKDDQTVKMDQFHAMEDALIRAGRKPQTMVAEAEGHGFYSPKNTAELYRRMEAFLGQYIGPGASGAAK